MVYSKNSKRSKKNSKRSIKKRRASYRKNNKYQIGGTVQDDFLELVIEMDDVEKKIIIKMHEQVKNIHDIDKNISNIKSIFYHPTAFFKEDDKKTKAKVIEDANNAIVSFIQSKITLDDTNNRDVLWAFLAMYISLKYLVDIETGVKLAFLLYNNLKTTTIQFIDDNDNKNKVKTSVIEYIKNRNNDGEITFNPNTLEPAYGFKPTPTTVISLDTHAFEVRNEYINYIDSISDISSTSKNEHRNFYVNLDKDIKSYKDKEYQKEWDARRKAAKDAAIQKRNSIIKDKMPKLVEEYSDQEGTKYREYEYTNEEGRIIKFRNDNKKFAYLFSLERYGWTRDDDKAYEGYED